MELAALFEALVDVARRANLDVRDASFDPAMRALSDGRRVRGGLCLVRGERVVLVDAQASVTERIATLAAALASVRLEVAELSPVVRATIRAHAPGPAMPAPPALVETPVPANTNARRKR